MFRKIPVPLDGSKEAEQILPLMTTLLSPDGHVVLLQVIPPGTVLHGGGHTVSARDQENGARDRSLGYLTSVNNKADESSRSWSCVVRVSSSVTATIVECAEQEEADLILMYAHDRRSLKRMLVGSVAMKVQRKAPMEVRLIRASDLVNEQTLTH